MPLFCKVISDRLYEEWDTTVGYFKVMINNERFVLASDEYSREQIIPLYSKQEVVEDEANGGISSTPSRRSTQEDVPAPTALLAYPPLAYLLNSLLLGFNLLRECPILRLRDEVLDKMASILDECCVYLIQHSESISTRGAKYISKENSMGGKGNKSEATSNMTMNELYANQMLSVFIPHLLACFEHIFPSQKTKKKGKGVTLKVIDPSSPDSHALLKENLSPDLCELFHIALDQFSKANLVKALSDSSDIDVSEQLSKLKSGGGGVGAGASSTTTV